MQLVEIGFGVATVILGTLAVAWGGNTRAKVAGLLVVLVGVTEVVVGAYL